MKLKVIGMVLATIFFIVLMVLAYETMWSEDRPEPTGSLLLEDGDPKEVAQVLEANELLYSRSAELQKTNDSYTSMLVSAAKSDDIAMAEAKVAQAEKSFKNTIDKVETTNLRLQDEQAKNSLAHIISSYRLLLKFQSFENVSNHELGTQSVMQAETMDPKSDLKTQLKAKDERIARLEKQINLLQNTKNASGQSSTMPADYQELVNKNKYLNLDLRSVIVTNLTLAKEYEALKKTNKELTEQLRLLKK